VVSIRELFGRSVGKRVQEMMAVSLPYGEQARPVDGGFGVAPTDGWSQPGWSGATALGDACLSALSEMDWSKCPVSGAVLPKGDSETLDGAGWIDARKASRQELAFLLARCGADTGNTDYLDGACRAIDSWLDYDRCNVGIGWVHTTDVAVRVIRWGLILGWVSDEIDPSLRRRLAGAVKNHAEFLKSKLSLSPGDEDHRLLVQAVGLVVAGLMWPELPGAGESWSRGVAIIGRYLPKAVLPDGAPASGDTELHGLVLQSCLVARGFCMGRGISFPAESEAALVRGCWFLRVVAGGASGFDIYADSMGELLPVWDGPTGESVWAAVVGLGLASGAAEAENTEPDRQGSLLAGIPIQKCGKLDLSDGFEPFGFREGGWAVIYGDMAGRSLKLVAPVSLSSMGLLVQPKWSIDGTDVLVSPQFSKSVQPGDGTILSLRREPRKVVLSTLSSCSLGEMRRTMKLQGSRLEIADKYQGGGDIITVWNIGAEWTGWESTDKGWISTCGDRSLILKLYAGLEWSHELRGGQSGPSNVFVGRGIISGGEKVVSRFELR
jgi:hypothetical protein